MRTRRALCPAGAPASLERSPPLPLAHRTGLRALPQGPSGPEGQRLAQGPPCGTHHRLHHAGGNRHWPQGPEETPPPWLHTPREQPRPGLPCPVPAPLRPWSRSPHPSASQALGQASATALTRRAHEQRCSGPHRPAFPGVLHPWGRPRPDHPPIPALVPGGGRATDRDAWLPSRAPCVVPVHALAPIARARCHAARRHAGRRAQRDPQGWARPWHGHRHATPTGPTSVTDRAPEVCPVAIAHRRMGRRTDRPVPCTSRTPDRARPRPLPLDAMALLRRCLPHGWPDGVRTGRPVGCLPARWPRAPDTIRPMRSRTIDAACPPPPSHTGPPPPCSCPDWGGPPPCRAPWVALPTRLLRDRRGPPRLGTGARDAPSVSLRCGAGAPASCTPHGVAQGCARGTTPCQTGAQLCHACPASRSNGGPGGDGRSDCTSRADSPLQPYPLRRSDSRSRLP